jgi:maltose alpha-D-glucosyltransferase/alpha-amylase
LERLARAGIGSTLSRIHGDFHLGQVLIASGDACIIDFEGEPGRSLEERRAKASPLRDVAGLIRSLDYAAAATLDPKNIAAAQLPPDVRENLVISLRDDARQAFLDAYRASSGTREDQQSEDLLNFFLIEKATYELAYEAANRPAWLPIPVMGLARLADRVLSASPGKTS